MTYKIGLQTDALEGLNSVSKSLGYDDDSALILAAEAQKQGHELFYFTPDNISYCYGEVIAWIRKITIKDINNKIFDFGDYERVFLKDLDIILMRQERPYNLKYLTNCRLLSKIDTNTLIINNPYHVQTTSDHWFVTAFPEITPPTVISCDPKEIKAFRAEHKDVILKPLYSRHGEGKYHLTSESENIDSYMEMFAKLYDQMIIAQKYIAHDTDRKIIVIDGKPVGAYDQPITHYGAKEKPEHISCKPVKAVLSKRNLEICEHIAPTLKDMNITIASVDIIGDYMIEIDINSPVGLGQINQLNGINCAEPFWEAVFQKLK
ncbi:MAG: hypothetical protein AB7U85_00820 [Alphaproteobacteria bacterium]